MQNSLILCPAFTQVNKDTQPMVTAKYKSIWKEKTLGKKVKAPLATTVAYLQML